MSGLWIFTSDFYHKNITMMSARILEVTSCDIIRVLISYASIPDPQRSAASVDQSSVACHRKNSTGSNLGGPGLGCYAPKKQLYNPKWPNPEFSVHDPRFTLLPLQENDNRFNDLVGCSLLNSSFISQTRLTPYNGEVVFLA